MARKPAVRSRDRHRILVKGNAAGEPHVYALRVWAWKFAYTDIIRWRVMVSCYAANCCFAATKPLINLQAPQVSQFCPLFGGFHC